jgi:hypothetical protein
MEGTNTAQPTPQKSETVKKAARSRADAWKEANKDLIKQAEKARKTSEGDK